MSLRISFQVFRRSCSHAATTVSRIQGKAAGLIQRDPEAGLDLACNEFEREILKTEIANLKTETMLKTEVANLKTEAANLKTEAYRQRTEADRQRNLLALMEIDAIERSQRAFIELLFFKAVGILERSNKPSDEDKRRLRSNKMTWINAVVADHWHWLGAELFPGCDCILDFPTVDNLLLYARLSDRVHRPLVQVIFVKQQDQLGIWPSLQRCSAVKFVV